MSIEPKRADFEFVEREFGPLPSAATVSEQAERFRLAQTAALLRLANEGELKEQPGETMRQARFCRRYDRWRGARL